MPRDKPNKHYGVLLTVEREERLSELEMQYYAGMRAMSEHAMRQATGCRAMTEDEISDHKIKMINLLR